MIPLCNAGAATKLSAAAPAREGGPVAILVFTVLNGLGVVFLLYVLVQFWKEGHGSKKPGTRDQVTEFSLKKKPTVIVVTRRTSGGLQVEPAPVSGGLHVPVRPGAFSVKVEPALASHSAHAGLSVVCRQARMSGQLDRQVYGH